MSQDRTPPEPLDPGRDPTVARAFLQLLRTVRSVASGPQATRERMLAGAHDFAQLLALPGLARLLVALRQALASGVAAADEGLLALAAALEACEGGDGLSPLRERDAQLMELAERLGREKAVPPPAAEDVAVPVEEALAGLRVRWPKGSAASVAALGLTPAVAVALRAALEWLLGDGRDARPLEVHADDTVLEVVLPRIEAQALTEAGEALARCGGALAPAAPGAGTWRVRVPWRAPSPSCLLVHVGEHAVALPWAAVLRVSMLSPAARDALSQRTGWTVLDPLGRGPAAAGGDGPVVLLGLGLRRALLAADRLVWRMPCSPDAAAGTPPVAWLERALLTTEGKVYWEADLDELLPPVASPPAVVAAPVVSPAAQPEAPAPPALPEGTTPTAPAPALEPTEAPTPAAPEESVAPPAEPAAATPPAPAGSPAPASIHALVAEDSITASIFLARLLEAAGARCERVDRLSALSTALAGRRWDVLCVDVDLPEARAGEALKLAAAHGAPTVALTRDAQDEAVARRAGVTLFLRKPFDQDEVRRMLLSLFVARG